MRGGGVDISEGYDSYYNIDLPAGFLLKNSSKCLSMLQWWKGNNGSLTDPAGSPISPITYRQQVGYTKNSHDIIDRVICINKSDSYSSFIKSFYYCVMLNEV